MKKSESKKFLKNSYLCEFCTYMKIPMLPPTPPPPPHRLLQPTNTENQPLLIVNKTETVSLKSLLLRWRELVPFLGVFAPLVVFWAIFYQQNSTWVQQGDQMDYYLGSLHVPHASKHMYNSVTETSTILSNLKVT